MSIFSNDRPVERHPRPCGGDCDGLSGVLPQEVFRHQELYQGLISVENCCNNIKGNSHATSRKEITIAFEMRSIGFRAKNVYVM